MTCNRPRTPTAQHRLGPVALLVGLLLLGALSACTQTKVVQVPVPVTVTPTASSVPIPTALSTQPADQPTQDYYEQFASEIQQVRMTIGGKQHLCEVLTPGIATPSGYYCWAEKKGPMSRILRNETMYMHPDFYCPKNPDKPCNANPDQLRDPKGLRGGAPVVDAPPAGLSGLDAASCTYDGTPLYGSVHFTSSAALADVSVYISSTSAVADLNVYAVDYSAAANDCGLWYPVSSAALADFTVYVTSSPAVADLTIHEVDYSSAAGV